MAKVKRAPGSRFASSTHLWAFVAVLPGSWHEARLAPDPAAICIEEKDTERSVEQLHWDKCKEKCEKQPHWDRHREGKRVMQGILPPHYTANTHAFE
eukprot:1144265-Pelagomonas_calceolata.AAC.4